MEKWLLSDLHIHSTFSDGTLPAKEIITLCGKSGFDVIAITDHLFDSQSPLGLELCKKGDSVSDPEAYFKAIEDLSRWAKEEYDLLVIPGLEICNIKEDYHILAIDIREAVDPNQDAERVIESIHRQHGLAIASHPPMKLSYFLHEDNASIRRHPLHLWNNRKRYAGKIDAWEIANRDDLFGIVGLERYPYVANSDFHDRPHFTSWRSLIYAEKETEKIKKAIVEKRVSLFFFKGEETEPAVSSPQPSEALFKPPVIEVHSQAGDGKARILIADDERDLVEMLSYNLGKKGYQVLKSYDGFDAWKKIESEAPDLVILDLMMPELDGWDLCGLIRKSQAEKVRNMGILMLTARAQPEDRTHGLETGADDYLTKPFSVAELILRVEKILQKGAAVSRLSQEMEVLRLDIKSKEDRLNRIVHDLKTPLISMGASAKLLISDSSRQGQGQGMRFLQNIYDSSVRMTQWIEDILRLQQSPDQGGKEEMKMVDIQVLVKQQAEFSKAFGLEKNIEVVYQAGPPVPAIRGHAPSLQRAIENLISNAIKYTPEGGRVEISVVPYFLKEGRGIVEISVKDTGIGIAPEDQERVFEPFCRGRNVSSETGVGLGLALVKEVVDLHGGKILVQSDLNLGSTFSILLPVGDPGSVGKNIKGEREEGLDRNMKRT
jgi:signal transduction histidine kinase/predicted metal-dependent phosphoesterase TrpH